MIYNNSERNPDQKETKKIKISMIGSKVSGRKESPTENRTQIIGFKVQCANHYTIGPS